MFRIHLDIDQQDVPKATKIIRRNEAAFEDENGDRLMQVTTSLWVYAGNEPEEIEDAINKYLVDVRCQFNTRIVGELD